AARRPATAVPRSAPPAPFGPREARGTVAALPATGPVPQIAAPSLRTGPIPVVGQERVRRPVGRWFAVAAALVVAGGVVAQLTAQQSVAEPAAAVRAADTDTSDLPTTATDEVTTAPASPSSSGPGSTASSSGVPTPTTSGGSPFVAVPVLPGEQPTEPGAAGERGDDPVPSPGDVDAGSPSADPSRATSSAPSRPARPSQSTSASPSAPASTTAQPSDGPSASAAPTESPESRPTAAPTGDASAVRSIRAAASDAGGKNLDLGAGTWRFDDFRDDLLGVHLSGSLVGAGSSRTTIAMTPKSSSKRSSVPKKAWTTNQLSLLKVSGATRLSGFTLRGTEQGHLYNGLRISKSSGTRITDVKVLSVPGNDDIPPGETFGINDFHTDGSRYSGVEVDGNGIASANFGTNSSKNTTIVDSWFHDSGHANGATFWQTRNVTVRDTRSTGNYDTGFNFERVSGDVLLDHVTVKGNRLAHLRINSDQGSADYRIVDPVFDGPKLKILMTAKYMGHANLQKRSDVKVIISGVDRTDEVVQWVTHF
ncbi:hypothetical protein ACFSBI_04565, partial [Amnibacterium endophyticum]